MVHDQYVYKRKQLASLMYKVHHNLAPKPTCDLFTKQKPKL